MVSHALHSLLRIHVAFMHASPLLISIKSSSIVEVYSVSHIPLLGAYSVTQTQGSDPPPLLGTYDTTFGVLCPVLGLPVQEGY